MGRETGASKLGTGGQHPTSKNIRTGLTNHKSDLNCFRDPTPNGCRLASVPRYPMRTNNKKHWSCLTISITSSNVDLVGTMGMAPEKAWLMFPFTWILDVPQVVIVPHYGQQEEVRAVECTSVGKRGLSEKTRRM